MSLADYVKEPDNFEPMLAPFPCVACINFPDGEACQTCGYNADLHTCAGCGRRWKAGEDNPICPGCMRHWRTGERLYSEREG